jgi:hypothetical protein
MLGTNRMSQDEPQQWHLDKKVNVGHILTTLLLAASMVGWAMTLESRIAVLATEVEGIKTNETNQTETLRREMNYIRGAVDKVGDKLDRLIIKGTP